MTVKQENLEAFAKRIETRIKASAAGTDSMERLICRLMTGSDAKVAAVLASKWVEWRYGKPTERHEHTGAEGGPISHTIRFADGSKQ